MSDPLEDLGRRTAQAVAERQQHRPAVHDVEGVRRRIRRGRRTRAVGWLMAMVLAVPMVGLITRPDSTEIRLGGGDPAVGEWAEVEADVFAAGQSAGSVAAVTVASDRVVAVGIDPASDNAHPRPGVWLSDDGRQWRAARQIDEGDGRYQSAGLLMTGVAAASVNGQTRLVGVGYANFEPRTEAVVWVSDDLGETWHVSGVDDLAFSDPSEVLTSVTATDRGVVAVGYALSSTGSRSRVAAWSSIDGRAWNAARIGDPEAPPPDGELHDVAASDGRLVALGSDGDDSTQLWASDVGWTWERATIRGVAADALLELELTGVTSDDGRFTAFGSLAAGGESTREAAVMQSTGGVWERAPREFGLLREDGAQSFHDFIRVGRRGDAVAAGASDGRATIWSWTQSSQEWVTAFADQAVPPDGTSVVTELVEVPSGMLAFGLSLPADGRQQIRVWYRSDAATNDLAVVETMEPRPTPRNAEASRPDVRLRPGQYETLAAAATQDATLKGHVVRDTDGLRGVWRMANTSGSPPELRPGTVGVVVFAREAQSTCRSVDDVVGVKIVAGQVVVELDPDGAFVQPCPGPDGAHAWTTFVVAIPDRYDDPPLTGAKGHVARGASGGTPSGRVVLFYLRAGADPTSRDAYVRVERRAEAEPSTPEGQLTSALRELVKGPTAAEREQHDVASVFSGATADIVKAVSVDGGSAVVDFTDFRDVIPQVSTSHAGLHFMTELSSTVFAVRGVDDVQYRIDGDCETFGVFMEAGGCHRYTESPLRGK